ncbi:MAG: serine hydrolase [Xanthomonadales bacterium]|nr:serine hydrolase [Xanthomonadales bacterium]
MASIQQTLLGLAAATCLINVAGAGPVDTSLQADTIGGFAKTLSERIEEVPGFAVAVVRGDEVVLAEGYGHADIEAGVKADADTLFYIASTTKSFTGTALNLLHHRGEIDLDASLADYAPGVTFKPEIRADEVKLRDLLTHSSGIDNSPIGFRVAYSGEHSPKILWDLLQSSEPNTEYPLGMFQYTNVGYNILTRLAEERTGKPWQDMLRDEIFGPLGMHRTTAYVSKADRNGWSKARPYFGLMPSGPQRAYLEKQDNTMQSAGGLLTTANDAARWMSANLSGGVLNGKRLLPEQPLGEARARLVPVVKRFEDLEATHYGLGWAIGSLHGREVAFHPGGFAGFYSNITIMPKENIGVAVFTNGAPGEGLALALMRYAYAVMLAMEGASIEAETQIAALESRISQVRPRIVADLEKRKKRQWDLSRPFEDYAGVYRNELYGDIVVSIRDGVPHVTMGNMYASATPFPHDEMEAMRVELVPFRGELLVFRMEDANPPSALRYDGDLFERVP